MFLETWEEAERAMADYARLSCEARKLAASEEEELQRVREEYQRASAAREEKREQLEEALKKFAQTRKREFCLTPEGRGRTYSSNGVSIGFRQTPPAVRIRDEEAALAWLAQARLDRFLRVSREPDREALKSALSNGDSRLIQKLRAHGISLEQRDKFFVEAEKD